MSRAAALLAFWIRPAEATAVLERSSVCWFAPLVPAAGLCAYLLVRGCGPEDAGVTAAALVLILAGLGLGGGLGAYAAAFVTGSGFGPRERIGPCLVFASWTALLFVLVLLFCRAVGALAEAPLFSAMVLLVWGGAAGSAVVTGSEPTEGGRALVGSCIGLFGALLGLWAALFLVYTQLLLIAPAPADFGDLRRGDPMLVRRSSIVPAQGLVLLQRGRESLLALVGPDGGFEPVGNVKKNSWTPLDWHPSGRVFFRFGGSWGGSVVFSQRSRE